MFARALTLRGHTHHKGTHSSWHLVVVITCSLTYTVHLDRPHDTAHTQHCCDTLMQVCMPASHASYLCITTLLIAGVSVVEDIEKRREPLPLAAVYFISPTPSSIGHLVADFESKPLYPSVHVFFSSGVTQEAVDKIKHCRVRTSQQHVCLHRLMMMMQQEQQADAATL